MGISRGDFVKYPRTPHLFGSKGTADDKHLDQTRSSVMIGNPSLIVEEKLDGTNVGIQFSSDRRLLLQCRGHLITAGMHPQYDLFKQWANVKRNMLESLLGDRHILFGEWMHAKHSIHYHRLPHYFFEFDIYDKQERVFLKFDTRMKMLEGTGILTVPIVHQGPIRQQQLDEFISESAFGSQFDNPFSSQTDNLMEGLYLRTETDRHVSMRAKFVRPEFVERIKRSHHWQHSKMIPNQLIPEADIWS